MPHSLTYWCVCVCVYCAFNVNPRTLTHTAFSCQINNTIKRSWVQISECHFYGLARAHPNFKLMRSHNANSRLQNDNNNNTIDLVLGSNRNYTRFCDDHLIAFMRRKKCCYRGKM